MQRTAAIDRDVVGDIDKGVDGPLADGFEACLHPCGRRAVVDAFDVAAGENRTERRGACGEIDDNVDRTRDLALDTVEAFLRLQRAKASGGEIARDAANACAVGAVRCQLHFDDGIADAKDVNVARAHFIREFGVEIDDAGMIFRQLHFAF